MEQAHSLAADTIQNFIEMVKEQKDVTYMAKLRFRDPDYFEQTGEEQFLYIWLNSVYYHVDEKLLSGVFFEVPQELQKWHKVGDRLGFDPVDVFDWMINDEGHVMGGFTVRLARKNQPNEEARKKFDEYCGITSYEPI